MSVVLHPLSTYKPTTPSDLVYMPTNSISIITNHVNPDIERYVESWGYTLNNHSATYLLYLNDVVTNINLDRHLGHIINMSGISEYIAFDDSISFITCNKTIQNFDDISKAINEDSSISHDAIKSMLEDGFPYRTKRGIILHRKYLDNILHNVALHFNNISTVSPYIESRNKSINKTNIPKIIHQTFETRVLPSRLSAAIDSWLNRNPEYEYKYYDEGDRRKFINIHFDARILAAYDRLIPRAYKADLWRYCVIYIEGGVYVDIKMGALVPLNKIIDTDTDMVFVNDEPDDAIYNAFFASIPRNPLIYNVIMKVVSNIESDYYGISPLYPTGPIAMGSSILSSLGYHDMDIKHLPCGKTTTSYGIMQVYSFHHTDGGGRIGVDGEPVLIRTRHTPETHDQSFLHRITGYANYGILWNEHKLYQDLK